MNLDKHRLMGLVRNSAQLAYDAARELEDYVLDHTNHLSSSDLAVIKNAREISRDAWRRVEKTSNIFRAEVDSRKAIRDIYELKV